MFISCLVHTYLQETSILKYEFTHQSKINERHAFMQAYPRYYIINVPEGYKTSDIYHDWCHLGIYL